MAIQQYQTKSAEDTQKVGEKFARKLFGGEVIALYGELGTGKTTFVQGLARGLGVKEQVVSPSYILIRQYGKGPKMIHIDLYRLEGLRQVQDLGLDELFEDKSSIVVVEWADRMQSELPGNCIKINFEFNKDSSRKEFEKSNSLLVPEVRCNTGPRYRTVLVQMDIGTNLGRKITILEAAGNNI